MKFNASALAFCLAAGLAMIHAAAPSVKPLLEGRWPAGPRFDGEALDIKLVGNYAYVGLYDGLAVFDVTNPTNGVLLGRWMGQQASERIAVSGNFAYVAGGQEGFHVIDVSDPRNP